MLNKAAKLSTQEKLISLVIMALEIIRLYWWSSFDRQLKNVLGKVKWGQNMFILKK